MASKKPTPAAAAPKAPVVAPGPKAPVVAPPAPTKLGPNDVEVKTWDEAEKQYRTRLQSLLAGFFHKDVKQASPDPFDTTPLNAIMAQVPVHLLEHSKTGVCEINITVKLMRQGKELVDKTLTPLVQVNLDGRNNTPARPQPPHIGFSLNHGAESHVFVKDPLPKGLTVRGQMGDPFEPFATATLVKKRGKPPAPGAPDNRDTWNVTAEIRRRPASAA